MRIVEFAFIAYPATDLVWFRTFYEGILGLVSIRLVESMKCVFLPTQSLIFSPPTWVVYLHIRFRMILRSLHSHTQSPSVSKSPD